MKSIKIEIPKGYEIDKEQSTFENIILKPLIKGLPKTWEELSNINGYYVGNMSNISFLSEIYRGNGSENTFVTKEQAKASVALSQLSQLMKVYNDGWIPDWSNECTKYVIMFQGDDIIRESWASYQHFLAFQTREIRDEFLENFRDLITIAKPLL